MHVSPLSFYSTHHKLLLFLLLLRLVYLLIIILLLAVLFYRPLPLVVPVDLFSLNNINFCYVANIKPSSTKLRPPLARATGTHIFPFQLILFLSTFDLLLLLLLLPRVFTRPLAPTTVLVVTHRSVGKAVENYTKHSVS